jgi:hypothetical protein
VPICAVKLGRRGLGVELSAPTGPRRDLVLQAAEAKRATPSLFDFEEKAA